MVTRAPGLHALFSAVLRIGTKPVLFPPERIGQRREADMRLTERTENFFSLYNS